MSTTFKSVPAATHIAITIFLVSALSACGGGGAGSSDSSTTNPTPSPSGPAVNLGSTLVGSVPAPSYAPNSEALSAFNLVNAERAHCGFGILAQNAQLDRAAAAHTQYELLNHIFVTHEEIAANPGFTGADPGARGKAQGYTGGVGEVAAASTVMPGANSGESLIRLWLSAPYHESGLLNNYRDLGISVLADSDNTRRGIIDLGVAANALPQMMASADIITYPCDGSTGVNRQLRGESPSPVPGRVLGIRPIGTPVLIRVRSGNTLVVTSASMVKISGGQVIALRPAIGSSNDPNGINGVSPYLDISTAYIAPDAALEPNAQYQMGVNGTNNGVPFSRNFTFTTGSGD
jgi:uncharacterized protein YkwD